MWAHYCREGKGICLAFDEDPLANSFPTCYVGNVIYSEEPAQIDSYLLSYARHTGKLRHMTRLIAAANRAAYFIKRLDWQYESERRLIVDPSDVQDADGRLIATVRSASLRHIILGPNIERALDLSCEGYARASGVPMMKLRVGRRSYEPFFSQEHQYLSWTGTTFDPIHGVCPHCGPDAQLEADVCRWCGLSDEFRGSVASGNMLSVLLELGLKDGVPMPFAGLSPKGHLPQHTAEESNGPQSARTDDFDF